MPSAYITALKAEIDTDPLTRAYSGMTDQQVADDLNTSYRPDEVTIEQVLRFLVLENTHKTDGTDTQDRSIWTRMKDVVALAVTPTGGVADPWGSTSQGNISEIQQIKTGELLDYFTLSAQGDLPVDLSDTDFQVKLAGAEAAGCMSTAQETALLDLGDNQQTRAAELGFPKVKEGHVATARALP